jgi:MFS family permease
MPWTATPMVCAPIAGRLVDKVGERRFVAGGLLLQAAGMGWIAMIADTGTGYLEMLPALIIGSAGLTMAMPAAQKAVVGAVQPREIGQASGAFMMLRILGGVFGTSVTVAVFAGAGGYGSAGEFSVGFSAGMTAVAALAFVGALVALGIPGKRPPALPEAAAAPSEGGNSVSAQTQP